MRITIDIPTDEITEILAIVVGRLLNDSDKYPVEVISRAISDGVTKAIADQLPRHGWSDELVAGIGESVGKAVIAR